METYKKIIQYTNTNGKTQTTTTNGKNDYIITLATLKKLNYQIINEKGVL